MLLIHKLSLSCQLLHNVPQLFLQRRIPHDMYCLPPWVVKRRTPRANGLSLLQPQPVNLLLRTTVRLYDSRIAERYKLPSEALAISRNFYLFVLNLTFFVCRKKQCEGIKNVLSSFIFIQLTSGEKMKLPITPRRCILYK